MRAGGQGMRHMGANNPDNQMLGDYLAGVQKNTFNTAVNTGSLVLQGEKNLQNQLSVVDLLQRIANKSTATDMSGVVGELTVMAGKQDTTNINLGGVNANIGVTNTKLTNIDTSTSGAKNSLEYLKGRGDLTVSNVAAINGGVADLKTKLDTANINLGGVNGGISDVNGKLNTANTSLQGINTNVDGVKINTDGAKNSLEYLKGRGDLTVSNIAGVNDMVGSMDARLGGIGAAVNGLPTMGDGNLVDGDTSQINDDSLYNQAAANTYSDDAQSGASSFLTSFISSNPILSWVSNSGVVYGGAESSVSFAFNQGTVVMSAVALGDLIDNNGIGTFFIGICTLAGLIAVLRD